MNNNVDILAQLSKNIHTVEGQFAYLSHLSDGGLELPIKNVVGLCFTPRCSMRLEYLEHLGAHLHINSFNAPLDVERRVEAINLKSICELHVGFNTTLIAPSLEDVSWGAYIYGTLIVPKSCKFHKLKCHPDSHIEWL